MCSLLQRLLFFSPSVTRQSLKLVLTRPAELKSKKICCAEKRRDVRTIVALFSTVRKNLKSWQVKDKRGAAGKCGYSSVVRILLQIKAEYFIFFYFSLSRAPICFVLTNIYLSDRDHSVGKKSSLVYPLWRYEMIEV